LKEARHPETLIETAREFPDIAASLVTERPLLKFAVEGEVELLRKALVDEQLQQQELDRQYWKPLMAELERLRLDRRRKKDSAE
jgi:hypothetical protein